MAGGLTDHTHLKLISDSSPREESAMHITEYWGSYMRAQDLGQRTITERIQFIEQLEREVGEALTLTRQDLIMWTATKKWSNATRLNYRSRLITFFTWLQDEGFRPDNPAARLPKVKYRRREPTPFTITEIETLLASGIYKSTRAMVALHYYLGLRVSEIAAVHGCDVDHAKRTITVIGKGRKHVVHPVPAALWPLVESMPTNTHWFPNRAANKLYAPGEGHILGNSVSTLLCSAIKRAGLEHKAHDLRAATATEMNTAGVSAYVIQKGMRHSNADTTNRYLGITVEQVRQGLNALPTVQVPERSGRKLAA